MESAQGLIVINNFTQLSAISSMWLKIQRLNFILKCYQIIQHVQLQVLAVNMLILLQKFHLLKEIMEFIAQVDLLLISITIKH